MRRALGLILLTTGLVCAAVAQGKLPELGITCERAIHETRFRELLRERSQRREGFLPDWDLVRDLPELETLAMLRGRDLKTGYELFLFITRESTLYAYDPLQARLREDLVTGWPLWWAYLKTMFHSDEPPVYFELDDGTRFTLADSVWPSMKVRTYPRVVVRELEAFRHSGFLGRYEKELDRLLAEGKITRDDVVDPKAMLGKAGDRELVVFETASGIRLFDPRTRRELEARALTPLVDKTIATPDGRRFRVDWDDEFLRTVRVRVMTPATLPNRNDALSSRP